MYKKNNGSTEQEILQNQFSAYVKKAVHNRRIQFLTEKSRKFRFETPLFDLDYLLFDTTDIIQEITDHETVRQALRSLKENERRIVLERIIEEKSFGQLSDELGMSYKTVSSDSMIVCVPFSASSFSRSSSCAILLTPAVAAKERFIR